MKKNIKLCFSIILAALLFSCNKTAKTPAPKQKEIDPFESALPHGSSLPIQQLSKADQAKLAKAIGKTVQEISFQDLMKQFEESYGKLSITSFWKLDCPACKNVNLSLQKIQHELGNDKLSLNLINLDSIARKPQINAYIRSNNFTSEVFILKENRPKNWKRQIIRSWEGELPALYLINKSDGTDSFYQQEMSYEELFAVIQALTM